MKNSPTAALDAAFNDTGTAVIETKPNENANGFTYLPATFDKACEWSDYISRSGLVPDAFRTPKGAPEDASKGRDVYLACARGAELGMKPLQSLMNIAVVNGRTTLSTDAKKALCMQYGDIKSVYDDSDGVPKWTCTATRKGHSDVVITFSAQDAVIAGLMSCEWVATPDGKVRVWKGRSNAWVHYWKRMLLKRAMSWCCDEAFPDVLSGFGTTEDYSDMDAPAATTESVMQSMTAPVSKVEETKAPEPVEVEAEIEEVKTVEPISVITKESVLKILDSRPNVTLKSPGHTTDAYKLWAQRLNKCETETEVKAVGDALKHVEDFNPFDSSAIRALYKTVLHSVDSTKEN